MSRFWRVFGVTGFFLILGLFGWAFFREWQKVASHPITAWTHDHHADCAVVLTGGPHRVFEGFDLLNQGQVKKLIVSGVHPKSRLRQIFPNWPFYGQLDPVDVILERRSGTTFGNAQQSLPLIEALHCKDIILVTSQLHMYRAKRTFKKVFPEDFPIYARATVGSGRHHKLADVANETLKSLFYSLWAY